MPARKRQRKQNHSLSLQPTLKRAPKRTPKRNIQFRHVNVEEPVSEHTDLTLITTRSWSGLLRHRIAPGGFLRLVERLEYEQWSAIVDAGFGYILSVRTKLIPKSLARWLLEKYDPWDNSLNLANGKLLTDEEDVYTTLRLPMGEFELFYMNRVQFRGRKVERSFSVAINWDTDKVRNSDKDEQLSGGYGKGRILERIYYQTITHLAEVDLGINMQEMKSGQPHKQGTSEMSRGRPSKEQRCPFCPHYNGQHEGLIHVNNDPIQNNVNKEALAQQGETATDTQTQKTPPHTRQVVAVSENIQECVSLDDAYYYSPEFLEQLNKLESIAREEIQHRKKVACNPPTTPAPSAHSTPGTDHEQWGENTTLTGPPGTSTEQQKNEGSEHAINPEKAPQTREGTDKAPKIHEIIKAKQVVKRQQSKRMVTQVPFQCRSSYLKDYREARDWLTHQ
ncbi:hypothetical protein Cgig2_033812 [Carnegiea gigantea]|uniref:Uncharacterized protein n=1 Tax=Carnegiea gigantea TaxID=171969 RepID=A0A9Q1K9N7_9CARY|nr:hypothetical protein Cgig2_033812 [Carnegiea gigantea]